LFSLNQRPRRRRRANTINQSLTSSPESDQALTRPLSPTSTLLPRCRPSCTTAWSSSSFSFSFNRADRDLVKLRSILLLPRSMSSLSWTCSGSRRRHLPGRSASDDCVAATRKRSIALALYMHRIQSESENCQTLSTSSVTMTLLDFTSRFYTKYLYNICAENARLKVSEANRRSRLSQSKRLLRKYSYSEFDFGGKGRNGIFSLCCGAGPVLTRLNTAKYRKGSMSTSRKVGN